MIRKNSFYFIDFKDKEKQLMNDVKGDYIWDGVSQLRPIRQFL